MNRAILLRKEYTDQGTFGLLTLLGYTWRSLELPWRDNARGMSCIPLGVYEARVTYSPGFKRQLYELFGVPNRAYCRVHSANLAGDKTLGYKAQLEGCIALGKATGVMELDSGLKQRAVLISQTAIREFMTVAGNQPLILEVRNA